MAVGIAPADVLALDAAMFDALEAEAAAERARWTIERELAAELVELTSGQLVAFLAANGVKRPPAPIRVPRPTDDEPELDVELAVAGASSGSKRPAGSIGAAAFAARFAGRTVPTSGAARG